MGDILVADDDKSCRESIQRVLEREGHVVQAVENVDEALEALDIRRFDLVVCDYRMPGKNGLDLLIELKRRQASIPVFIISSHADPVVEEALRQLGALMLMKKPIRRQELIDRAAKVMGG